MSSVNQYFSLSMAPMKFLILLVVLLNCLTVHLYVVEAAGRSSIISSSTKQQEDIELERQLRILNKPPIKTIHTQEGDIFDCIDIHRQPAFDNPLLINHKIQMIPASIPSKELSSLSKILKPIGCPQGSVPIRRTSKEDLIRAKSFSQSHISSKNHLSQNDDLIVFHYEAVMLSKPDVGTFFGAQGEINIAGPTVGNGQYSGAQIWVEAGGTTDFNTIQAGWGVAPFLFGDNQTRIVVYWSATGHLNDGCFNQLCPGFVQVDKDYTVGAVLNPVSQYKGEQTVLPVTIYQDKDSGDWWFQAGEEDNKIGYWPKSLFNQLNNGASRVAWGGTVKGTENTEAPPMGNGKYPSRSYYEVCSVTKMGALKDTRDNWSYNTDDYRPVENDGVNRCYDIKFDGLVSPAQGYSVMFGGPGGDDCE